MKYTIKQLSISDSFVECPEILVLDYIFNPATQHEEQRYMHLNKYCSYNGLKLHSIVHNKRTTLGIFEDE